MIHKLEAAIHATTWQSFNLHTAGEHDSFMENAINWHDALQGRRDKLKCESGNQPRNQNFWCNAHRRVMHTCFVSNSKCTLYIHMRQKISLVFNHPDLRSKSHKEAPMKWVSRRLITAEEKPALLIMKRCKTPVVSYSHQVLTCSAESPYCVE